jgi:hypothetical protein
MKARIMSYTEAIGLALVIAAVLGGWARSAFERPGDPDIACVLRLEPSGGEVALRNLHCLHVAATGLRRRPTLAGNVRAGDAQAGNAQVLSAAPHVGAAFAAAMDQPCDAD